MLCDCFSAVLQNFRCYLRKTSWGLNNGVGISADLWRHPPIPTQATLPTNRKPFIFRWKAIWFAWCGSRKNPPVKSKPFFRETINPNLLLLGEGEIGATGHLYFRKQKNLERHNWRAASRSSSRLANFFFGTFFFLAKKKVERSPLPKGKFYKKPRQRTEKKYSFCYEIFRVGKILSFSHSIRRHFSATIRRFIILK